MSLFRDQMEGTLRYPFRYNRRISSKGKILVCGDRNWKDYNLILEVLKECKEVFDTKIVIQGECRGADLLAKQAAEELGMVTIGYQADWAKHGRGAGPIRNAEMLTLGKPHYALAFHDSIETSKGTADMVRRLALARVPYGIICHEEQL